MADNSTPNGTLVGWKEIARALDVSVSTAQRWARELGLPIYKLGGQVRLKREELARWEKTHVREPR